MKDAPTWMATQAKATILYKEAFWRSEGLSGRIASQLGPLAEAHDHTSVDDTQPAIFGFVGLPVHARQSDKLTQAIIDQLVRCFGDRAADVQDIIVKDWAQDKNICSQRDLETPPQHPQTLPNLIRQGFANDTLHFAVAETATQSPGLIDGAIEAGTRAAQAVIDGML
jgi:monoamine oxidase